MKFHSTRYAITSAFGALTTGLLSIQFSYFGLLACILVGLLCYVVIPMDQAGDQP